MITRREKGSLSENKYSILLSRQAQKFLDRSDPSIRQRLLNILELLSVDPYQGKELTGPLRGKFSWRVGSYRIIYEIVEQQIQVNVIAIGHRDKIYEKI